MTEVEALRTPTGRPTKGLDRDVIVRAALRAIDARGPHSLTMRGLGQDLGVEAMSLYRYVSGREDLLEAVVAMLLENFRQDLDQTIADTWQGYLQSLAHAIRRIAVEHPAAFPLVATRHPSAPWLRPPLRSLELVEQFLSTLLAHGFSDVQAVGTYRAFTSFLLGQLLLESAARGAETGPAEDALDEGGASVSTTDAEADTAANPTVVRLRSLLSEDHSEEEFEIGLETLLDRLEMALAQ
ncbi:TetR/AcrR family transcriptional regulator C-terminal domain-containing protein [Microlunatus spumicola]|uniref:TetR/AcrR family transcriptional regulator C-terminal domain-containing protein n=1 Tax=Microlunatus spumicola TaxID=81499 RepID=A0ABP6XX68_9ACTN